MDIELKHAVKGLLDLRPFDSFFRPVPSLKQTNIPPIPYAACGYDFTMTSPKGHVPPSQRSRAERKLALADKHLIVKERLTLMRTGACDPTTNTLLDGDGVIG